MYASDGKEWKMRHEAYAPSLRHAATLAPMQSLTTDLLNQLSSLAESAKPVDLHRLLTLFSLDTVSQCIFGYNLGAVSGSEEGKRLYDSLETLAAAQAAQGIYTVPDARKVTAEELEIAKKSW